MPDLDEILRQTMLWAANPVQTYRKLPFPIQNAQPIEDVGTDFDLFGMHVAHVGDIDLAGQIPKTAGLTKTGEYLENAVSGGPLTLIAQNPVWNYKSPVFSARDGNSVVRVESVTCRVRDMKYMKMPVLEEIEWGPVKIFSPELGREVELPLTSQFLIKARYVPMGHIEESDCGFWQLPAKVDQSWELAFGYEIPLFSSSSPVPLKAACWNDSNLMMAPRAMVCPGTPDQSHNNTLCLPALRVVVCVSLVCCKERRDFDPGGLFGGGRIYPLIMAISNLPLERLTASVLLARPKETMHTRMGGEQMSPQIASYLFADRNSEPSRLPPMPVWNNLFEYYLDRDVYPGEYQMVRLDTPDHGRCAKSATTKVPGILAPWKERLISKVPRQGEFDNIHFAPKMIVPNDICMVNADLTGLRDVTMAPFCVHDCLHMHWRWGTADTEKWNLGWADDQTPYAVAGAPLVPTNQKVTLRMLSPVKCLYTAEAQKVAAGEWQVVMHHGAAYALAAGQMANSMMDVLTYVNSNGSRPIVLGRPNWALFYWCLRYTFDGWTQIPRLTWDDGKLTELRKL